MFRLNQDDIGDVVAKELFLASRFRSMIYLASSLNEKADPFLSKFSDTFLTQCVKHYLDKATTTEADESEVETF